MAIDRNINPFAGPKSFTEEDQDLFFGRDDENERIISLIYGHKLILLYGQSGSGKSSILNAKICPTLKNNGFDVLPITRVGIDSDTAKEFVNDDENNAFVDSRKSLTNFYIFNALKSLKPTCGENFSQSPYSLADFLRCNLSKDDENTEEILPQILIFDQLEELFTVYPSGEIHLEGIKRQQEEFFEQVSNALVNIPQLRIIFVINEDFLSHLEYFATLLPEKLRPRYHLDLLEKEAATLAIRGPIEKVKEKVKNYDEEKIDYKIGELVDNLLKINIADPITGLTHSITGEFVEPIQLQVVCYGWWNDLLQGTWLSKSVDVDRALREFYDNALIDIVVQSNLKEERIRRFFEEKFITPNDTRGFVHIRTFKQFFSSKSKTVIDSDVDKFFYVFDDTVHIIRGVVMAGSQWYELTHDRLIAPIKKSNDEWFTKENKKKSSKKLILTSILFALTIIGAFGVFNHISNEQQSQLAREISLSKGIESFDNKNYHQALEYLVPLTNQSKNKSFSETEEKALKYIANAHFLQNNFDESIKANNQLLALNSSNVEAKLNKANSLFSKNDSNNSKKIFEEVIDQYPNNSLANLNYAILLLNVKEFDRAIEYANKVLFTKTDKDEILKGAIKTKAYALANKQQYLLAEFYYDILLAINANDTGAIINKVRIPDNIFNYTKDISLLEHVRDIEPQNHEALMIEGNLILDYGNGANCAEAKEILDALENSSEAYEKNLTDLPDHEKKNVKELSNRLSNVTTKC